MKKVFFITVLVFWIINGFAQKINLESIILTDTNSCQVTTQRVEVASDLFLFRYDYQKNGGNVLNLTAPKVFSNSWYNLSTSFFKLGEGASDRTFCLDLFNEFDFGSFKASVDLGRIIGQEIIPNDFMGVRVSYGHFTSETYIVAKHPIGSEFNEKDQVYSWAAYHPDKMFVSVGIADKQYWFLGGTKNLNKFGNFSFVNYNPENGNFWFRSQSGFGEIDNNFFNQNLYLFATNYLIVPPFHFRRFSPIATKGTYSFKVDGRRINDVHYYEMSMGRKVENLFRMAVGVKGEYRDDLRLGPILEFYKDIKFSDNGRAIVELRYDFLCKSLEAYLVFRY